MDLSSEDESATIATVYGATVIQRAPFPIVEPLRNEVAAHAHNDWILALDPDERVSPALARALQEIAMRADIDAVVIPRMNCDFGYPPSHPIQRYEPQLRMYRRSAVTWPTTPNKLPIVPAHRKVELPKRDEFVIIHDRSRNIPEVLERSIRYAPAQAQSMIDRGEIFSARAMLAAITAQIDKEFFWAEAWKDGVPGYLRAFVLVSFKVHVWAAFWQKSNIGRTPRDDRFLQRLGYFLLTIRRLIRLLGLPFYAIARLFRRKRQPASYTTRHE